MKTEENILLEEVILKRFKIGLTKAISNLAIENSLMFEMYPDYLLDSMIVQMSAYLAGNKVHEQTSTEYGEFFIPRTWWDALKEEKPLLQKIFGKTQYKILTYETKIVNTHNHMCPHIELPSSDPSHIMFLTTDDVGEKDE